MDRRSFQPLVTLVLFVAFGTSVTASNSSAQLVQTKPFETSVAIDAWAINDLSSIRKGQVSVIQDVDGPRLAVYYIGTDVDQIVKTGFRSFRPRLEDGVLNVSSFDHQNRNSLGGYFNTFQRGLSVASLTIAPDTAGAKSLLFRCHKVADNYCGMWIHLFDFSIPRHRREYLDTRDFHRLEFFARRENTDARFLIKTSDALWEEREDALVVGSLDEFRVGGAHNGGWIRVSIPLDRVPARLDRRYMAGVVFEQVSAGDGELRIRDMAFISRAGRSVEMATAQVTQPEGRPRLATWVWNTADLLLSASRRDSLLGFLESQGVSVIFLQLPHDGSEHRLPGEINFDRGQMRLLLREANRRGFQVYGLDGYAFYALPEFREGVLSTVRNVVNFNMEVDPSERFAGIRYDIEPYLIPGFHGPSQASLLRGLVSLLDEMSVMIRDTGLKLGADIPFWYDELSEYSGKPISVSWRGVDKPASEHIIDIADDIAIMDYRTTAYGADGTIRHATRELEYASTTHTPVYIALETHPLPDEVLYNFSGVPQSALPEDPGQISLVAVSKRDAVIDVHFLDLTNENDPAHRQRATSVLRESTAGHQVVWWSVSNSVRVPADKLSFANLGAARLREVMRETTDALSEYSAFAGIAIHHEGSFRELLSRSAPSGSLSR